MFRSRPRAGWLIVAVGVIALGVLGVYLVINSIDFLASDPNGEGWPYIAWSVSPLLAAAAGVAIGILLMLVARFKLIDLELSRAAKATGLGCAGAPVVYVISMFVLVGFLNSLNALWLLPLLLFALPIVVGIATVLGYVVRSTNEPTSKTQEVAPPPL